MHPVFTFEINLVIAIFRSLMIDNSDYQTWPPSEIRQRPDGLAEERRRNGDYTGAAIISFSKNQNTSPIDISFYFYYHIS
jgi:hypothetical protein